jgi:subtilase family protein
MDALDLVHLPQPIEITAGRSDIMVGLIDGLLAIDHPDFAGNNIRKVQGTSVCARTASAACLHGTLVAGVMCAKRGSVAPAICPICPKCTFLARSVFKETNQANFQAPNAPAEELAAAILACMKAGVRVLNLSLVLMQTCKKHGLNCYKRSTLPQSGVC